jgi:hypothetical protein
MPKSELKSYLVTVRAHTDITFAVEAVSEKDALVQAKKPDALDSSYSEEEYEYEWAGATVRPGRMGD